MWLIWIFNFIHHTQQLRHLPHHNTPPFRKGRGGGRGPDGEGGREGSRWGGVVKYEFAGPTTVRSSAPLGAVVQLPPNNLSDDISIYLKSRWLLVLKSLKILNILMRLVGPAIQNCDNVIDRDGEWVKCIYINDCLNILPLSHASPRVHETGNLLSNLYRQFSYKLPKLNAAYCQFNEYFE